MKNKGIKTSVAAIITALLMLGLFIAFYQGKMTSEEFFKGLPVITAAAVVIIGLLSKDHNASHTKD